MTVIFSALTLGCSTVRSAPTAVDKLKTQLQGQIGSQVKEIKSLPVSGWYEINLGADIFYSDAQGRYLLVGQLIDLKTHENLTATRLADLSRINFTHLPLVNAIKVVKGKGMRRIAVFSDPNCPYCRELEHSLAQMDNITIYTFLYPVLSPDSMAKAQAVWCAANRPEAWQAWITDKKLLNATANCDTSVLEKNIALGRKLNITGTPTIFLADGRRLAGTVSAEMLEKELAKTPQK